MRFVPALVLLATAASARIELQGGAEIGDIGESFEIVKVSHDGGLVGVTDPIARQLFLFHATGWNPPRLSPLDLNTNAPGVQGVPLDGEPTSVAFHPRLPLAFVTVLGPTVRDTGTLRVVDLRPGQCGQVVLRQALGQNPDSVAVSPDGHWLLVANEAEEDPETPGSIEVVDLRGLTNLPAGALPPLPARKLDGLPGLLGQPAGVIEPEFVAFDPQSRFAAVTCQENDAVVVVDLRGDAPALRSVLRLPEGADPDGVSVLDGVADARGVEGCLIAVAEEGREISGSVRGQCVDIAWVDPQHLESEPRLVSRVDVRPLFDPAQPLQERSPEGIELRRWQGHDLALVGVEKGDWLLVLDLADPVHPHTVGYSRVGDRPEGVTSFATDEALWVLTGDEGKLDDGRPGHLTITRLREAGDP